MKSFVYWCLEDGPDLSLNVQAARYGAYAMRTVEGLESELGDVGAILREAGVETKDGASAVDLSRAAAETIARQNKDLGIIRKALHKALKGLAAVGEGAEAAQDAASKAAHTAAAWADKPAGAA